MSKKRGLVFLILICLLTVGVLTPAATHAQTAEQIHFASATPNVDGSLSERVWNCSIPLSHANSEKMDALWTKDSLFVAVEAKDAAKISVRSGSETVEYTIAGGTFNKTVSGLTGAHNGSATELKIPFAALGLENGLIGTMLNLTFTVTGTTDSVAKEGAFVLVGDIRLAGDGCAQRIASKVSSSGAKNAAFYVGDRTETSGKTVQAPVGWYQFYDSGADGGKRSYLMYNGVNYNMTYGARTSFDLDIDTLPVTSEANRGMWIMMAGPKDSGGYAPTVSITFTQDAEGKLIFRAYPVTVSNVKEIKTGLTAKGLHHITLLWNTDGSLTLEADDVACGTVTGVTERRNTAGQNNVVFNSMGPTAKTKTQFALTNVAVCSLQYSGDNLLKNAGKTITFDTIRGSNTSAATVLSNLTLPSEVTVALDDQKIPVVWSSSDTDVISNAGVVSPDDKIHEVELTATLKKTGYNDAVQKFNLMVPGVITLPDNLTAEFSRTTISVDGDSKESPWLVDHPTADSLNIPTGGAVDALWDFDNLYLAVNQPNLNNLTGTLNGKSFSWNGTDVSGDVAGASAKKNAVGNVEISLPFAGAGVTPSFQARIPFTLSLTCDSKTVRVHSGSLLELSDEKALLGDNGEKQTQKTVSVSSVTNANYVGNYASTAIRPIQAPAEGYLFNGDGSAANQRAYLMYSNVMIDPDGGTKLVFDVDFRKLPVTNESRGMWISLTGPKTNGYANNMQLLFAASEDGELLFRGVPTSAADMKTLETGLPACGKYHMEIVWEPNGSATLCVNGAEIGVLKGIATEKTTAGASNLVMNSYTPSDMQAAVFAVSHIQVLSLEHTAEYALKKAAGNLTAEDILGDNANAALIRRDLVLPQSIIIPNSGNASVIWGSDTPDVISHDGTVAARESDTSVRITGTLTKDGYTSATVKYSFLVPGTGNQISALTAYYTETAPTLNGVFDEPGWMPEMILPVRSGVKAPDARVDFLWQEGKLFAAVEQYGAETVTVSVNGKSSVYTISSGIADGALDASFHIGTDGLEISVPLADVTLTEETVLVNITAENSFGTVSFGKELPLTLSGDMILFGENCDLRMNRGMTASAMSETAYIGDCVSTADAQLAAVPGTYLFYDDGTEATQRRYIQCVNTKMVNGGIMAPDGMTAVYDMTVDSMPVYDEQSGIYGFWVWIIGQKDADGYYRCMRYAISKGEDGKLILYVIGQNTAPLHIVPLDVREGQNFVLAMRWEYAEDTLTVSVDGKEIKKSLYVGHTRTSGAPGILLNTERNYVSPDDPICVELRSLRVLSNKYEKEKLLPAALEAMSFDAIGGVGNSADSVTSDLILPDELSLSVVSGKAGLTWESSQPDVISPDGKVSQASTGRIVRLTVSADYEGYTAKKEYVLFVPGTVMRNETSVLVNDLNPVTGTAVTDIKAVKDGGGDKLVLLDADYTSVVLDLGSKKEITHAELHFEGINRISKDALSLYAAEDNGTFTRISGWDLLKTEDTYYFYNFSTETRYLKLHCHLDNRDKDAGVYGSLQDMLTAGTENSLLRADGQFAGKRPLVLQNTGDEAVCDAVFSFTLAELKIAPYQVKSDLSDIRFVANGRQLPVYVEGETISVRVGEMSAGEKLKCTVYFGNKDAKSISDGEAVFENLYGTKTVQSIFTENIFTNIPGTVRLSDDTVLTVAINKNGGLSKRISQDGGRTWSDAQPIPETVNVIREAGGFLVDGDTIFMYGHSGNGFDADNIDASDMRIYILKSTDGGQSWSGPIETNVNRSYYLTYSNGLITSVADGAGPNVDYVVPFGAQYDNTGALCTSVMYSRDGGSTWLGSESTVTYGSGAGHEGGVSESYVTELSDGRLMMISRCQVPDVIHLVKSYSDDYGVTWLEQAQETNVYSPNTQPVLYSMGGKTLLVWGGNNAQGGASYQRYPLSVAWSDDDCENFVDILDLYAGTSLVGVDNNGNDVVNPHIARTNHAGSENAVFTWYNLWNEPVSLLIEDFNEYLDRTSGAFDSFERGNLRYEGWLLSAGNAEVTTERASDGNASMRLEAGTAISRTVPYLTKGTLEADVYFDRSPFELELQAAYCSTLRKAAPVSLSVKTDGTVWAYDASGQERSTQLRLRHGWNRVSFCLDLPAERVTLELNKVCSAELPIIAESGLYVCATRMEVGGRELYLDRFAVCESACKEKTDWEFGTVKVTFDKNGGDEDASPKTVDETYDEDFELPETEPTRTGYTFTGWYTDDEGGTKVTEDTTVKITEDTTLYAHWTVNKYLVTFDSNGGYRDASPKAIYETYGAKYDLPATDPARFDYTFIGWYTDDEYGTEVTEDCIVDITEDITLYAHWLKDVEEDVPPANPEEPETHGSTAPDCPKDDTCPMASFSDLKASAWYHDGIHYCVEEGLMNGVGNGKFNPGCTTTRAMIVTLLWRLEGSPVVSGKLSFKDVKADQWYTKAILWANSVGLVEGYNERSFGPNDKITREQFATILYRYALSKGEDVTKRADLSGYTDSGKVSSYAEKAMQWAVAEGLITGRTETTLVPTGNATRAEAANLIYRFCKR